MAQEFDVDPYPAAGSLSTFSVRYPFLAISKPTQTPMTPAPMMTASYSEDMATPRP